MVSFLPYLPPSFSQCTVFSLQQQISPAIKSLLGFHQVTPTPLKLPTEAASSGDRIQVVNIRLQVQPGMISQRVPGSCATLRAVLGN